MDPKWSPSLSPGGPSKGAKSQTLFAVVSHKDDYSGKGSIRAERPTLKTDRLVPCNAAGRPRRPKADLG